MLHKRQSIANFLQERVKMNQHELDAECRVSFLSYIALRYPRSQKFLRLFGMDKRICLDCALEMRMSMTPIRHVQLQGAQVVIALSASKRSLEFALCVKASLENAYKLLFLMK